MTRYAYSIAKVSVTALMLFSFGCAIDPEDASLEQDSKGHTQIHPEDDCDPVTFGALCRAGFHGQTTLDSFRSQFAAAFRVPRWEYGGGQIRVNLGSSFRVD